MVNSLRLLSVCSAFAGLASGFHMPFQRRASSHSTSVTFKSSSASNGSDPFQFTNVNGGDFEDIYVGTILVGGQSFEVQLDTGSSDLWLDTTGVSLQGFTDTGVAGSIVYGDQSSAQGPILVGNVTFGDFTVSQQAFMSSPGSNATTSGDKGLLGLGPPGLSTILQSLAGSNANGNSFLDNVFSIYPQDANFITFSLSRSDLGVTAGGTFTIAEIPDQFSAINSSTSLLVLDPGSDFPMWACSMDDVTLQGQSLSAPGSALLDTGTSLSAAPSAVVDAIYGSIPGSQLDQDAGMYMVPCDSQIDISFVFSGVPYPVHPIDATFVTEADDGSVICMGSFTYNDPTASGVDFILGDAFLRNVFSLYDFGNWTTVGTTAPFVQILSTTDATQADSEFSSLNQARLAQAQAAAQGSGTGATSSSTDGGVTSTTDGSDPQSTTTTSTEATKDGKVAGSLAGTSPSSSSVDLSGLTRNTYIIMGLLGGVIFMLLVLAAVVMMTRGNKGYRAVGTTGAAPAPYQSTYNQYSRTSVDDKYHDT